MTTQALSITVNGESRELSEPVTLAQLIASLDLKPEQVAIELNQVVIRRAAWENTLLKHDDRIEIVHFVGGG